MATVGEDQPQALALFAQAQEAQNTLSQLSSDRKDPAVIKAARDAMLKLKEDYKTLTGHYPKLEIAKKEKPAAAAAAEGETISKRFSPHVSLMLQRAQAPREG
jgi:hypothetical protein